MNNIFKIALVSAPIFAAVFYYVVHEQQEQKAEMRAESKQIDRDFAEGMSGFGNDKYWNDKKANLDKEAADEKANLEVEKNKTAKIRADIDKAMEDVDSDKKK